MVGRGSAHSSGSQSKRHFRYLLNTLGGDGGRVKPGEDVQSANHASACKVGAGDGVGADVVVTVFEVHAYNSQVMDMF